MPAGPATLAFHQRLLAQLAHAEAALRRDVELLQADPAAYEAQRQHEEQCAAEEYAAQQPA